MFLQTKSPGRGAKWCRAYRRWRSKGSRPVPSTCRCRSRPGTLCSTSSVSATRRSRELRERVRSALIASGLALPAKRITVNLAPADMPKEGSHYDLPIALGVMAAIGAIPLDALEGYAVIGELALDGTISAVAGVLPAAIAANAAGQGPHLPGGLRARGGLGLGRSRHSRAPLADPARQPFQGDAGALAPAAGLAGARRPAAGPARHQGAGERQARARNRRGRRAQSAHERRARGGQVDARPAPALDPAAADAARTARSVDDPFGCGDPRRRRADRPAALPRAPSFGLDAGPGRRRRPRQARRDFARPQRRALSRRTAGVPAPGSRQPAPADRDGRGRDRPRQPPRRLSRALPAGGGDEPVPLRLGQRAGLRLPARAERALRRAISRPPLGAAARPVRSRRSTSRPCPRPI